MGCLLVLPKWSQVVASEYRMIDRTFASLGSEFCTLSHQSPLLFIINSLTFMVQWRIFKGAIVKYLLVAQQFFYGVKNRTIVKIVCFFFICHDRQFFKGNMWYDDLI